MRRAACLSIGIAVSLFAAVAPAQQAPPAGAPAPAFTPPPVTRGETPRPPAPPVEEPLYNPAEHGGISYGAWLRATRGSARRSTGMMVTGISLAALGTVLLATGTGVYVSGTSCANVPGPTDSNGNTVFLCGAQTGLTSGMALMAAGLIGLGIGLPLTFLGAADVPRAEAADVTRTEVPRASVAVSGLGAAFTVHF